MQLLNDIRDYDGLSPDRKRYLIAFLVALSGILSALDYLIPKPLPFLKIGIANCVSLALVWEGRTKLALAVAILRSVVASLFLGTFMSFTFLLSVSGGILSVAVMGGVFRLSGGKKGLFSPVGISVWGSFASILGQGVLVGVFFGFDRGLLLLLSAFVFIGLVTGVVIGYLVQWFYRRAEKPVS